MEKKEAARKNLANGAQPEFLSYEETATMKLETVRPDEPAPAPQLRSVDVPKTPELSPIVPAKTVEAPRWPRKIQKQETGYVHMLQDQCRRLCLSLFFRQDNPVRSLGFTSSIGGEGKSFLALTTARLLSYDSSEPVTLIECNWEHPTLHEQFDLPATPGLAEWLRGTCEEHEIRYQIDTNLTLIPAGNGMKDAVRLINQVRQRGLQKLFGHSNELFILDLPPVIAASYGSLAARLTDTVMIVVHSEIIPPAMLSETISQLKDASVHGIILNREKSSIPRWIRQFL